MEPRQPAYSWYVPPPRTPSCNAGTSRVDRVVPARTSSIALGLAGALMIARGLWVQSGHAVPGSRNRSRHVRQSGTRHSSRRIGLLPLSPSSLSVKADCHRTQRRRRGCWPIGSARSSASGPNGTRLPGYVPPIFRLEPTAVIRRRWIHGVATRRPHGYNSGWQTKRNLLYKFDGCFDTTSSSE